jgi:HB1, ASXL, restriction endonuclease HTH domain
MAKQRTKSGEPAKQVAIHVLREAGEPLRAKEIAKRVLDSGRARLSGKTPEQTITAMLAVGSKPGGPFTRVDKGTYTLAEAAAAGSEQAATEKPAAKPKPRPRKRQQETPAA